MWLEVFSSGKHTDSSGRASDYSLNSLDEIATKYNSLQKSDQSNTAPIVKGHPASNDPALGWVDSLARRGSKLFARIKNIDSNFLKELKDGKFKKVSISLYPDKRLRHIGFLGAASPAVSGLEPISFSESKNDIENLEYENQTNLELNDIDTIKEENAKLQESIRQLNDRLQDLNQKEIASDIQSYSENIAKEFTSKKIQKQVAEIISNLLRANINLNNSTENYSEFTEFADYSENTSVQSTKAEIEKLVNFCKNQILFKSYAASDNKRSSLLVTSNIPDAPDIERHILHNKALELQNANGLSYEEALIEAYKEN